MPRTLLATRRMRRLRRADETAQEGKGFLGGLFHSAQDTADTANRKIGETADETARRAKNAKNTVGDKAQNAKNTVGDKANEAAEESKGLFSGLFHSAQDTAAAADRKVGETADEASRRARNAKDTAGDKANAVVDEGKGLFGNLFHSAQDTAAAADRKVGETADEASRRARNAKDTAGDKANAVVDEGKGLFGNLFHSAQDTAAAADRKVGETADEASRRARNAKNAAADKADETVQEGKGFLGGLFHSAEDTAEQGKRKAGETADEFARRTRNAKNTAADKAVGDKANEAVEES
eukprot:TRINITY_DN2283_c0_g1_i5.p4 TRINITY_DN2283_c0_g1~~TRINITY_DN2283_c0_g1_i5.p4  ORF type:complete len:296 (-),score=119.97 TRINITY_DN2283_c0_g1_i5:574-1461(-)